MAYEPTTWKTGDIVTSAKLNKLEQGVANAGGGGGVLVVNVTNYTLDKTWQEIYDAVISTGAVMVDTEAQSADLITSVYHGLKYLVIVNEETYQTDSAAGYPILPSGENQ